MKALFHAIRMLLALKCDESTRIISAGFERDLTWLERWSVRLHFLSCAACRRFKKQVATLQSLFAQRANDPAELSSPARERIAQQLRKG